MEKSDLQKTYDYQKILQLSCENVKFAASDVICETLC